MTGQARLLLARWCARQANATVPLTGMADDLIASEEFRRVAAELWSDGYSTCLGDFDIAARAGSRSANPYKSEAAS